MSKKKKEATEGRIEAVESALTKSERFLEENQKIILIVVGAIIVVILGFLGYQRLIVAPKEVKAANEIFMAQNYFELDSIYQALNGDGQYAGFLEIVDRYGSTKTGNLAKYYTGICYLKLEDFDNAIRYLKKFDSKNPLAKSMALGGIGDAYLELGKNEKAIDFYLQAAKHKNELTTPMFLMKAGLTYELLNDYDHALKVYEEIQTNYPKSYEARDIDRFIAKAKGMLK
ncbi:MAG TPA: tetratricopeptide repeat protein [Bacteroidales bacterium]|jgi:tetratricopeptide (TPR) repeat protein|nr:tetratricopeptide repeat protein [Bacteroidales bacterium]